MGATCCDSKTHGKHTHALIKLSLVFRYLWRPLLGHVHRHLPRGNSSCNILWRWHQEGDGCGVQGHGIGEARAGRARAKRKEAAFKCVQRPKAWGVVYSCTVRV